MGVPFAYFRAGSVMASGQFSIPLGLFLVFFLWEVER
jgi:hypothetical protein